MTKFKPRDKVTTISQDTPYGIMTVKSHKDNMVICLWENGWRDDEGDLCWAFKAKHLKRVSGVFKHPKLYASGK